VSIMSTIYEQSRYQVMATESMHHVGVSTTTANFIWTRWRRHQELRNECLEKGKVRGIAEEMRVPVVVAPRAYQ
jgi:hypothetical protein